MGRQREKKRKSSASVEDDARPVQDLEEAPVGETLPEDEARRLRERIRTLDIQLDTARVREDELTGQVVALEGNVEDLRAHVDELERNGEEIGSLTTEIATITEALDKERRRGSELAEARDGLEEEANRLSSQVTQLTEMIDEAKTDVVAEATRAGAAEDLLADARASQENLARERDDSRDEVQTVTRRLQGHLDELSAELEPLQEEARSAEARALERERNLERMQSTVQERDEELARLSEHIAALEAHLEDGQSALAARETELGEQQEALRALREEAERSGAESLEAAASERVAAEARVTQAEQRATQAEQTAASLGDELGAARTALSNLENAHDAVRMRVADLQTEVEHKVNRVHELEEQLATKAGSEAEVNRVTAELEQIRTEFESAKAEAVAAASSAEVAHAEREAAVERIAELEGNIEERQRDGAQQEAARDLDLDEVRAQLVDAQGELARVNADLATARSDTADLER
jgi:chromosome segregation ATPase